MSWNYHSLLRKDESFTVRDQIKNNDKRLSLMNDKINEGTAKWRHRAHLWKRTELLIGAEIQTKR